MNSTKFLMRGLFQLCGFVHLVALAFSVKGTLALGNPVTDIGSESAPNSALGLGLRRQGDADGDRGGGRGSWRWCLICSGAHPDNRECELTPRHVTSGPGKMNCTRRYCTSHVRYQPSAYLVHRTDNGINVPKRVLTPSDFEVVSIARGCEDRDKGNTCVFDHDLFGVTCFSTCAADFCNGDLSKPQWKHLIDERTSNKNNVVDTIRSYVERTGIENNPGKPKEDSGGSRDVSTSFGSYKESEDDNEAGFHRDESEITEYKAKKHASNNNNNNNNNNGGNNNEGTTGDKSNSKAQKASSISIPNPGIAFVEKPHSSHSQISEASSDDNDDDDDDDDDDDELLAQPPPSYEQRRRGDDVIERANGGQTGSGRLVELRERRSDPEEIGVEEDEVRENLSTTHSPMYSLKKETPAPSSASSNASPAVLLFPVCSAVVYSFLL